MMTIKNFAELCGCTAQTLRYYDRMDLLRPVRVDEWSGYRYYEARQALDFVKIKNLQAADFTIGEIRTLLAQPDEAVYEAFEGKIAAQQEKLARIRQIQRTYLHEKSSMEKIYQGMADFLLNNCGNRDLLEEFGLCAADYDRMMHVVRDWMETIFAREAMKSENIRLEVNQRVYEGKEQVAEGIHALGALNMGDEILLSDGTCRTEKVETVVWERHGWAHPHEFLYEVPLQADGAEYTCSVQVAQEHCRQDLSYPMFMIGALLMRNADVVWRGCRMEGSADGLNHFALVRAV